MRGRDNIAILKRAIEAFKFFKSLKALESKVDYTLEFDFKRIFLRIVRSKATLQNFKEAINSSNNSINYSFIKD